VTGPVYTLKRQFRGYRRRSSLQIAGVFFAVSASRGRHRRDGSYPGI